jgi:hypothetical protein
MKATAVLRAVGYVPTSEHLPFEACPTSIRGVPTLCTITSRPPGMLGGWLWPGDPGQLAAARERPALGWLATHRLTDHGSMMVM